MQMVLLADVHISMLYLKVMLIICGFVEYIQPLAMYYIVYVHMGVLEIFKTTLPPCLINKLNFHYCTVPYMERGVYKQWTGLLECGKVEWWTGFFLVFTPTFLQFLHGS